MQKYILPVTILAAASIFLFAKRSEKNVKSLPGKTVNASLNNNESQGFVLMELFTSQGCSSCPPADELLGKYAAKNDPHIIPLSFHVDYWNRLGWKDSFSTAAFSARQQQYAAWFGNDGVYTPQVVLNGQKEMVGSDDEKIRAALTGLLKEMPAAAINIQKVASTGNMINIDYSISGKYGGATLQTVLVEKSATTHIRAGENNGVTLVNYNVVRDLRTVEVPAASGSLTLMMPAGKAVEGFNVILFLQDKDSGKVIAAAKSEISL